MLSQYIHRYDDEPGVSSLCLINPFSIKSGISTANQGPSWRRGRGRGRRHCKCMTGISHPLPFLTHLLLFPLPTPSLPLFLVLSASGSLGSLGVPSSWNCRNGWRIRLCCLLPSPSLPPSLPPSLTLSFLLPSHSPFLPVPSHPPQVPLHAQCQT